MAPTSLVEVKSRWLAGKSPQQPPPRLGESGRCRKTPVEMPLIGVGVPTALCATNSSCSWLDGLDHSRPLVRHRKPMPQSLNAASASLPKSFMPITFPVPATCAQGHHSFQSASRCSTRRRFQPFIRSLRRAWASSSDLNTRWTVTKLCSEKKKKDGLI